MLDLIFKNGTIIDGSGKKSYKGDVGIKDGKIVLNCTNVESKEEIDIEGFVITPGFIDAHSHGDLILGTKDAALFKITQGITTEYTGQCGLSIAPIKEKNLRDIQNMLSMGTTFFPKEMKNWEKFSNFINYADSLDLYLNSKIYVGHSTLRISVMGMENRPATKLELDKMKGILREAMESGAAGFSTGLIYTPSVYATEDEIIELAEVIEPFDGIYASHMRNESNKIVEAVKETINVGRQSGVRVDISHHKMLGRPNWGKQKETLRLIDEANNEGIFVFHDQYPYTANMTTLNATMPPWYLSEGFDAMTEKLKERKFREQLKLEMQDPKTDYDNYYLNAGGWDGVYVYSSPKMPEAEGKFISEYAKELNKDPWDLFFDICVENHCETGGVYSSMSEEDVCEIIKNKYCIVGSDGLTRAWSEKGHPRASGTFPHAINYFVKEKKILTLEEMINKMTGKSADFLRMLNKGLIKDNYDADLVIFKYDELKDTATYAKSNSITEGIKYVLVDGNIVYKDKEFTGLTPGKLLRH
ncbi:N-acyl-D-amino-acid deacylase family protein [Peptoniphilus sp. SGI.035]|uniref:N-acyl-D-amino-acid deacylase family protein n=1 Tax=Peptoniphilus sp. SGI.035 TaxID=3420564 RepID=UPI003CFF57CA